MIAVTPRERFIAALKRQPLQGLVPHFEQVFFLTMEAFGRVHPSHRNYESWNQMSAREQELHLRDMAEIYVVTAERFGHSAIFPQENPGDFENTVRLLKHIRALSGDKYFLCLHGDPTFAIPNGEEIVEFSSRLFEEEDAMKELARRNLDASIRLGERYAETGLLDGFSLCSDYCFNTNPFFSPGMFGEFVAPYLKRILDEYRAMGFCSIKHTDGNIMPILEQMVQCGPDALHSLDPQGGVSIPEVRKITKGRVALCGNVNCGLLQTGTEEECVEDVERSLREGMAEPGYIFCTSNSIYTGMPLERYELMLSVWKRQGIYGERRETV
ncbi:MAG: uroporphyrinogen decarboxylase family protein [Oscillospiraceae bacterium]